MKIYKKEEEEKKSWCLDLYSDGSGHAYLCAVDAMKRTFITNVITFCYDGDILVTSDLEKIFTDSGYDPQEHNNQYTSDGRLIIKGDKELI